MRIGKLWALIALMIPAVSPAEPVCMETMPGQNACGGPVVVAGPIASEFSFTTPLVFAQPGGPVTFVNADIDGHNVVSRAIDPLRRGFWCDTPLYPAGDPCPLFWSPVISTGTTQVYGLENVEPFMQGMTTYRFYCDPHDETMEGTMVFV